MMTRRIAYHLRRDAPIVIVLAALTAAMAAYWSWFHRPIERPVGEAIEVTITDISLKGRGQRGIASIDINRTVSVAFRSDTGETGRGTASPAEIEGCRVGDRIEAVEHMASLEMRPKPCR